tara:strand:- start:3288 stop:3791 length:504 start_codon:yes stop_codon:yes gene_type:complete
MPNYDYQCHACGQRTTHFASYEDRHDLQSCRHCGDPSASYVISMPNVTVFEPYHDEALNCDIHGARHRKEVMAAQGMQEAGDKVHGGRDFDESNTEGNGGILPLQGVSFDDQRRNEDKRRQQADDMVVGIDSSNAYGETKTDWYRAKDLESKAETKSKDIGAIIREG